MHDIELTWRMDQGSPGMDSDPRNPLWRAVNSVFIDGKPQESLSLCFFGKLDTSAPDISPLRWLGAFVFSAGKRVIFFPGFDFVPTWVGVSRTELPHKRYDLEIDHITLEKDLRCWHFTSPGSADHLGSGRSIDLGEGRFLWFGISVADIHILRELKRETVVTAQIPSSDGKRRIESFLASRNGAIFNCISMHPDARKRFKTGFFHFAFIVGPNGFSDYEGPNFGIPFGSPFLREPLPGQLQQVPFRLHRVSLGTEVDIEIVTIWLPGTLAQKVTITGPASM